MIEEQWPAFRPEFEGHIGSTFGNEPNDKSNAKRMADLYGAVYRYVEEYGAWRVWSGKHWRKSKEVDIRAAVHDMSSYMEEVESAFYEPDHAPEFPEDWSLSPVEGAKPYKSLMGKRGALTNDPEAVMAWASKSPARAEFIGERLKAEQTDKLFQDMLLWIERSKDSTRISAAIREARARPEFRAKPGDFDTVRETFVVQNGQIDTRTGEFTEGHQPEHLNTRVSPVAYMPGAQARLWRNYLATNLPNPKMRRFVQKLMGYAMSGDGNQKLIAFMYSQLGDTGKSLFLLVMGAVFGIDYSVALADDTLSPRRNGAGGRDPDRHALRGKRLVTASELEPDAPMDERFVKAYTGGDIQSTRSNFETENTRWRPEGLLLVASNHLMQVDFEDEAIWNRIVVIPWTVSFPKGHPDRDDDLADKIIRNELEGVLLWVVQGLKMYRTEGLTPPVEAEVAAAQYREDSDHVNNFIEQFTAEGDLIKEEHGYCRPSDLHKMAREWGKNGGFDIPRKPGEFNDRLQKLKFEYKALPASHPDKARNGNSRKILGLTIPDSTKIRYKLKMD